MYQNIHEMLELLEDGPQISDALQIISHRSNINLSKQEKYFLCEAAVLFDQTMSIVEIIKKELNWRPFGFDDTIGQSVPDFDVPVFVSNDNDFCVAILRASDGGHYWDLQGIIIPDIPVETSRKTDDGYQFRWWKPIFLTPNQINNLLRYNCEPV